MTTSSGPGTTLATANPAARRTQRSESIESPVGHVAEERDAVPLDNGGRDPAAVSQAAASRHSQGADNVGFALDGAGYVRTGAELSSSTGALDGWPLSRQPLPLETNLPGLFAAGDVRSGSIKRCAAAIGEGSMVVSLVHQRLAEVGGE